MTMRLIETKTLATDAASITFTSIPQDGTDLLLLISVRTARGLAADNIRVRFNGDNTDGNYSSKVLYGTGAGVSSFNEQSYIGDINASVSAANTFSSISFYTSNYTASVIKSSSSDTVSESAVATAYQTLVARYWNNTAAITSLEVGYTADLSNLVAGTTMSLYKITKGSDGIVTTS